MTEPTAKRPSLLSRFAHVDDADEPGDLAAHVARLEGGVRGFSCISPEAALALAVFSSVAPQARVLFQRDLAPATRAWFEHGARELGFVTEPVDAHDPAKVADGLARGARGFFAQQIAYASLRELDVQAVSWHCRSFGALLCIDNSQLTPYLRRPLTLGADAVVHPHLGLITCELAAQQAILVVREERLASRVHGLGQALGVFTQATHAAAFGAASSMAVRMEHAQRSARTLAERVAKLERAVRVVYPNVGVEFALMFADRENAHDVFTHLPEHARRAGQSTSVTHARLEVYPEGPTALSDAQRVYVRVGLEHVDDVWAWLQPALAHVRGTPLVAPYPPAP